MKIGIAKIETIDAVNVRDFSFYAPGSSFSLSPFLKSQLREIKFTEGTANIEETWSDESGGKLSTMVVEGINRIQRKKHHLDLLKNIYQDQVLRVTLKNKNVLIVGSSMFPGRFTLSNSITGTDTDDKTFTFTCKSPHGIYYDVE